MWARERCAAQGPAALLLGTHICTSTCESPADPPDPAGLSPCPDPFERHEGVEEPVHLESVYTEHHPAFGEGRLYAEHGYVHYGVDKRRNRVFIHNIEVEAAHQRQGLGRALLDAVADLYPSHDMDLGYTTDSGEALWQSWLAHRTAAIKVGVNAEDELPADPGTAAIPEGHVRLYHYTRSPDNLPGIREHGLLESHARGDGGLGAGNEPSAGVWASNHKPGEGSSFVEFHAHPDEISHRAEHPKDQDLHEWQSSGTHHVIMKGDVHPSQFVGVHEPWHSHARYMRDNPDVSARVKAGEHDNLLDDKHYGPAIRHIKRTAAVKHLVNPVDGTDEWHHGSPSGHDISKDRDYDDEDDGGDYEADTHTHWNSYLGDHFTSIPHVAEQFARAGFHHRYDDHSSGTVNTAKLGIHNPKQYPKETLMDREAVQHSWDHSDAHDPQEVHAEHCNCDEGLQGHEPGDGVDQAMKHHYSSISNAANWLTTHPDKENNADSFKRHLQARGHDGVVYGNEVEGPKDHPCAIAFDKSQIHPVSTRKVSFRNDLCKCCQGTGEHASGRECYRCDGGLGVPEAEVADKPCPCDGVVSEQSGRKDWAVIGASAYRPTEKIFGPTKTDLDPRLFEGDHLRDSVRHVIMGMLDGHLTAMGFPDWQRWLRVYLAGSESTFWWGNRDFDTLLGCNYESLKHAHPEFHAMNLQQISDFFNQGFRATMNSEEWQAPWDPVEEDWHLTFFLNPMSWDIRDIKPYGAYSLTDDQWIVRPPSLPTNSAEDFDKSDWPLCESYADRIRHILTLPAGPRRRSQANALLEFLHADRGRAFSPRGKGWNDIGNVVWKYLDTHPEHLLEELIEARKHPVA